MGMTTAFYLHLLLLALSLFALIAGPVVITRTIVEIRERQRFWRAVERATGVKL